VLVLKRMKRRKDARTRRRCSWSRSSLRSAARAHYGGGLEMVRHCSYRMQRVLPECCQRTIPVLAVAVVKRQEDLSMNGAEYALKPLLNFETYNKTPQVYLLLSIPQGLHECTHSRRPTPLLLFILTLALALALHAPPAHFRPEARVRGLARGGCTRCHAVVVACRRALAAHARAVRVRRGRRGAVRRVREALARAATGCQRGWLVGDLHWAAGDFDHISRTPGSERVGWSQ
jgi:hypothetical protein